MKTHAQAEMFVDHLRLVGIEASWRTWGQRKDWIAINIGGTDFLWKPGGVYDGWERYVGDATENEIKSLLDESIERSKQRRSKNLDETES